MRTIVVAVLAVSAAGLANGAYAASVKGAIKSIDAAKDMVTLDNGTAYTVPATTKLSQFTVGEKVNVTYQNQNGKMQASAVTPAT